MTVDGNWIDVDGVKTHYYDEGSGDTVLLVHGGGDFGAGPGADVWLSVAPKLSERFRVVAPDRLGQGRTANPPTEEDYSPSAVLQHLSRFVDTLSVTPVAVIGQSRGAFYAASLAASKSYESAAAVLVNSASLAPAYGAEHAPVKQNMRKGPGHVRDNYRWLLRRFDNVPDDWFNRVEETVALEKNGEARAIFARRADQFYAEFDLMKTSLLKELAAGALGRALLVWGVGDPMTTLEDGVDLFRLLEGIMQDLQMHVIDACGHAPFLEVPDLFVDSVTRFIAGGQAGAI